MEQRQHGGRKTRWNRAEGGVRVCGNAVLLDFLCDFAETAVLRFYTSKRFALFRN